MFALDIRILVVDDMNSVRKLVIKTFKELGYTDISEASDGAAAWRVMDSASPPIGLVLSDWNMPGATGIELLKKARADQRYGRIPFLLVTAESEESNVVEAVAAGVTDYLIKPFSPEMLKK